MVSDLTVQDQGVSRFGFFGDLFPWLVDEHLLAASSRLSSVLLTLGASVSKFPLRTPVRLDWCPSYRPHFNLINSLKALSPKTIMFPRTGDEALDSSLFTLLGWSLTIF